LLAASTTLLTVQIGTDTNTIIYSVGVYIITNENDKRLTWLVDLESSHDILVSKFQCFLKLGCCNFLKLFLLNWRLNLETYEDMIYMVVFTLFS